jgi:hypothetical protein
LTELKIHRELQQQLDLMEQVRRKIVYMVLLDLAHTFPADTKQTPLFSPLEWLQSVHITAGSGVSTVKSTHPDIHIR